MMMDFQNNKLQTRLPDLPTLQHSIPGTQPVYKLSTYIKECSKICWLMLMKSPPLHLVFKSEARFDEAYFKQYTKSGKRVAYVVWPVVLLHEKGPLLSKGVAQPV